MEQGSTVASILGQGQQQTTTGQTPDCNYTEYLTFFAIYLSLNYPNPDDLNSIQTQRLQTMARLCLVASGIAFSEWTTVTTSQQRYRKAA